MIEGMIVSGIKNKFFNDTDPEEQEGGKKKKLNKAKSKKKNKDFDVIKEIRKVFSGGSNTKTNLFTIILILLVFLIIVGAVLYVLWKIGDPDNLIKYFSSS